MTSDRAEFIREIPLFAGLPEDAVAEIAGRAEETHVAAGDWLFREGEVGERLYVLRTGRLQVLREVDGEEIPIRNLSPGAVLGELAVLTDAPRSASVRARRDSGLLGLSSDAFFELLDDVEFARALTRVLANQLQASRAVTVENDPVPPVIAVVPLADGVPSAAFAGELARAMAIGGSVKGLTEEEASEAESFGDVLDRWERAGDQVVLSVESPTDSDWRSFCLRQADRVVAVANADTPNGPPPAPNGSDLALLGWPGSRPVLRGLMSALEPRAVYHVQDGDDRGASAGLVARRLSGNSPGIVLSGGGARGLAHLGVLDELHKAGMAIDRVGGCSMGAIIGGLFASGLEVDEIEARLRAEFVDRNPISDYTLPLTALTRGRKGEAMLWRLYGDRRIEELEREFFCVSCDLVTSALVVHREGELAVGVGASGCLPGVIPPYALDGQLLVDGGIRDNLPVATMAARGEGPVLAVDVSSRFEPPARTVAGRPGLRRLSERARRAIVGWDEPRPSFPETLTRVVVLGSIDTAEAAQEHADAVIAPEVHGVGLVDFDRIAEIREQGAAAAREALDNGLGSTAFGRAALRTI
jgi:NTE family protein